MIELIEEDSNSVELIEIDMKLKEELEKFEGSFEKDEIVDM